MLCRERVVTVTDKDTATHDIARRHAMSLWLLKLARDYEVAVDLFPEFYRERGATLRQ